MHTAEMHRLMQDQIDELEQPAAVEEEKTASRRQEPAIKTRKEATRSIKRIDNPVQVLRVEHWDTKPVIVEEQPSAEKPSPDYNHVDLKEPIKLDAIPSGIDQYHLLENISPATTDISNVFEAETPTQVPEAAGQDESELDRLFDFQELDPSIYEIEPYASDGRLLESLYEEEPLMTEKVLPHSTDLVEPGVLPEPEAIFDDEVMDTFEQLMELVYGEMAEIPASGIEQHTELIDDQVIFIDPETPEPIEHNAFEEFVASIVRPEVSPDLDTIMSSANEQTLEETLVQLSLFLIETSQDTERPPVIQKTLRELAELVSRNSNDYETGKEKVAFTPELTQKLLTLLRAVGYDNPQDVLLTFVKEHDFEFLLQAIRHLSQLCNDDDRKELLHVQTIITPPKSDEPLTARLGKAILSLVIRFKVPEVAISD